MEGMMHILSPASAPWCGWIMVLLLVAGIFSEWLQPGLVTKAPTTLTARITDRMYKDAPTNFMGQLFVSIFRLGTITMAIYLCFYTENHYPIVAFGAVCALVLAVVLVKMLFNILVNYTFDISRRFGDMYDHYANITTLTSLALFPLVLILLQFGNPALNKWILGITALLFIGMWLYRSIRTYVSSLPSLIYWVMYICTLELLPIALLIYLSGKIISVL